MKPSTKLSLAKALIWISGFFLIIAALCLIAGIMGYHTRAILAIGQLMSSFGLVAAVVSIGVSQSAMKN